MKLYEYQSVPRLPKRIVDLANADIAGHHAGRKSFDSVFVCVVLRAQERVQLELLKMRQPDKRVSDQWYKFGFVPKTCDEYNDNLDAERLLVTRHQLRRAGQFETADALRKQLESWGYEISDEPNGTNWQVM